MVNKGFIDLRPNRRNGEDGGNMVYEEGISLGRGPIPPEIRKAIIMDRAKGIPSKIIAAKYDVGVGSVRSIWKEFAGTIGTRASDEDDPVRFKSKIRKKAIDAIENGLECDRDPYRRAGVGIKVMEGIGEFKGDQGKNGDVSFNIFVAGVPAEWRERYLGIKDRENKSMIPENIVPPATDPAIEAWGGQEIQEIQEGHRGYKGE